MPDALDVPEVRAWLNEAFKRNDRTYVALQQIGNLLPEVEGDLRRLRQQAEERQQDVRKALFAVRKLLLERGADVD